MFGTTRWCARFCWLPTVSLLQFSCLVGVPTESIDPPDLAQPFAIEAFFYDKARRGDYSWGGAPKKVAETRQGFLEYWKLDATDVPLLEFDRLNWRRPFSTATIHLTQSHQG